MTYAQLQQRLSSEEFEIHLALAMLRQDECPACGVEPRDLMVFGKQRVKCPVCGETYTKINRISSWRQQTATQLRDNGASSR